jgi:predicted nucleic acid-binding protein
VRVPSAVFRECTVPGKPAADRLKDYLRDKVIELDLQDFVIAVAGLGQGEREAMALYKRLHAEFLLMDDHHARKVAHLNGIEVVGTLGVLLRAKESGLISEIRPLIVTIQAAGVHYGGPMVDEVLRLAGE